MNNTVLLVKNLTKYYGKYKAVNSVSFDVKKGEIFALIGPNGAGKSTTLKIITTLLSPSSGQIKLLNFDIRKNADKIRQNISYLPEEAGAYKNLKGIEYLNFMADLVEDDKNKRKQFIHNAVEIAHLGSRINDKIGTYSKGMTRKLLLARTIMNLPKLAILDEPTSGLDIINSLEIRKTIKSFTQKGMSVLLSSHNMLEIEYLSDKIAIINKGIIHEVGTPQNLKKKYNAHNLEEVFIKVTK